MMAAALRYQVVVIKRPGYHRVLLPDLRCQALGATSDEAIAYVREQALAVLREYEGHPVPPPAARLVIGCLELPIPAQPRASRHLRLVPNVDGRSAAQAAISAHAVSRQGW